MPTAVYAGSFDPPTNGHLDIALRAAVLFDHLIIAVYDLPMKNILFSTEERVNLWEGALPQDVNISVEAYSGLTVDYAHDRGAKAIVRGLRAMSDFEYEFEMALTNKKLAPDIEEVFLMTSLNYLFISASRIKEVWGLGKTVDGLVPPNVDKALQQRLHVPVVR
ncbi:MAG: phosphopantetheine adenylyltransferase [Dehalococcoidia bacterium]|nr:phosphopantetheine adenylyltransferase [Dehalococcoidia bacterium]